MSTRRNHCLAIALVTLAVSSLTIAPARADLIFEFDVVISSSSPGLQPDGDPPWARATFSAIDNETVELTMEAALKSDDEFISVWYFNYKPFGFTEDLIFTHQSGVIADPEMPNVSGSPPGAFNQGGGGVFDIRFDFPTSAMDDRFDGTETSVYLITLNDEPGTPLSPNDFNYFSAPQGEQPLFTSAIHVQGIFDELQEEPSASAWIGSGDQINPIPEPSTLILLGLGLGGVALLARNRSSKT